VKKISWTGLVKYVVGFALLAYVVARNWEGENGLKEAFSRPVRLSPVAAASVFLAVSALLTFYRWWLLVRALELPFSLTNAVRLGLVGFFFNTVLPGGVGGDIVKAVGIAREQSRRALAISTVLFDRAVGLWGLVWLVALSGAIYRLAAGPADSLLDRNPGVAAIVHVSWAVTIGTVIGWWALGLVNERRAHRFAARLATVPKAGRFLSECWRATWLYRKHPWAVTASLALTLVLQVCNVLAFYSAAHVFVPADADLPGLAANFLVVPVGMAVEAFFPTPGGVGGGEYGYGKLYGLLGTPEAYGVLASLAQRVLRWALGLIGYVVYLRMRPPAAAARDPEHADVAASE
jgi:uncharacterized membrane protein YbhN (UPF0104 family)